MSRLRTRARTLIRTRRATHRITNRVLDFTSGARGWGHNIDLRFDIKRQTFRGAVWSTPRPAVGDTMTWSTYYGTAVALVFDVDYCRDPQDMCFVEAVVIKRNILLKEIIK